MKNNTVNCDTMFKIAHVVPAACAGQAGLAGRALALCSHGSPASPAVVAQLMEEGLWTDAIRYLAFALPAREGVWWACLSARRGQGPADNPAVPLVAVPADAACAACIEAAEGWVREPSEQARRACLVCAEAVGCDGAAGYAALAAFWTGNLAPPELAPIDPDPRLSPTAVGAAVLLAALGQRSEAIAERYRLAVEEALDIARGGDGRTLMASPTGTPGR